MANYLWFWIGWLHGILIIAADLNISRFASQTQTTFKYLLFIDFIAVMQHTGCLV